MEKFKDKFLKEKVIGTHHNGYMKAVLRVVKYKVMVKECLRMEMF